AARTAYESVERTDPLYDAVLQEWDAADVEAAEANAKWNEGAFEEARALWAPLAGRLEPLLARHQAAKSAADQARNAYEAVEKPGPLDAALREEWAAADRDAARAQSRFGAGAFDEAGA